MLQDTLMHPNTDDLHSKENSLHTFFVCSSWPRPSPFLKANASHQQTGPALAYYICRRDTRIQFRVISFFEKSGRHQNKVLMRYLVFLIGYDSLPGCV